MLALAGARLNETDLVRAGAAELTAAAGSLDGAYHPVALARIAQARAVALVHQAEMTGDVLPAQTAVDALQAAIELVGPDHSPLDWARLHHAQGLAWCAVAEGALSEPAFGRALQAFAKAQTVLSSAPNLALRTLVAQDRAACLVRRAETCGDSYALDEAEIALRSELGALRTPPDPVAWAVLQLNLARVYLSQAELRGRDRGERARAGEALLGAFEVFSERGLRNLLVQCEDALQLLREQASAQR